jgi:FkbM family methyltransferase
LTTDDRIEKTATAKLKRSWQIKKFVYDCITIIYPEIYYLAIKECFIFDVYRSYLIKQGDLVIDLGAGIGEFSVLASKKVGTKGTVVAIEPNVEDFKLLTNNIKNNNCSNVIPINMGVGDKAKENEMTFWGRKFKFETDTLKAILDQRVSNVIGRTIDFMKIDIEGYEAKVISNDIDIIKEANAISLELHNTKEEIDKILIPNSFFFEPIVTSYVVRKSLTSLLHHPRHFFRATFNTIANNPSLAYKLFIGYGMNKKVMAKSSTHIIIGTYIKR